MNINLDKKNIWLIGASQGIGKALAEELANSGARLILSARDKSALLALKNMLPKNNHMILPLDLQSNDSIKSAFVLIQEKFKQLDMVIYNAGIYHPMHSYDMDLLKAEATIDINLSGILRIIDLVIPYFIQQKHGHIVFTASVAGFIGMPNSLAYGASKAAIINLAQSLYIELKDKNIIVQLINPGFVKTRLTEQNKFFMPFIMDTKDAALKIVEGIKRGKFEISFPFIFVIIMKMLRLMPYKIFFKLSALFFKA